MDKFSQILEFKLNDVVLNELNSTFDLFINNLNLSDNAKLCTKNGNQSLNLVNLIDSSILQEISQNVNEYIKNYYGENLIFYQYFIDYIHFISYEVDGYQEGHTHHANEDHSFIIYLNDSNAETKIYNKNSFTSIKSEKGKMVIFDASLYHEANKCEGVRNVVVGAVKFAHKVWRDRR
jgi:hypothetical protein